MTAACWLRAILRGVPIAVTIFGLLPVVILLRIVGANRAAQRIVMLASRTTLTLMGLRPHISGTPDPRAGAFVANHSGWPDIFTLSAAVPVNFVSKAEVSRWPGIGVVARGTGTIFIERRRTQAGLHRDVLSERLAAGDRLLFFPEGTSTDNARVLPFRPSLFEVFRGEAFAGKLVQPVAVRYRAPEGYDPRLYAWWGDMDFVPHFLMVLGLPRQGKVEVRFLPAVDPAAFEDRKALAADLTTAVRRAVTGAT